MPYNEVGNHIKKAAEAHTDLTVFEAVMLLLEGSLVSADSHSAAARIIKICKFRQQQCLRRYDASIKKAGGGTYGRTAEE